MRKFTADHSITRQCASGDPELRTLIKQNIDADLSQFIFHPHIKTVSTVQAVLTLL